MSGPGLYLDPSAAGQLQAMSAPRPILFLDRDGVINQDHGYVHLPEQTDWIAGIFELCDAARRAGVATVVVTNQAGIARGLYGEEAFLAYTAWMHAQFSARGTPLLATVYCPHHPDAGVGALRTACDCRKPAPGMVDFAARRFGADLAHSVLVGNRGSDMQAALAAGVATRVLLHDTAGIGEDACATSVVDCLAAIELPHTAATASTTVNGDGLP